MTCGSSDTVADGDGDDCAVALGTTFVTTTAATAPSPPPHAVAMIAQKSPTATILRATALVENSKLEAPTLRRDDQRCLTNLVRLVN